MELTKKEMAYLELYKGIMNGMSVLRPDIDKEMYWYYAPEYNYKQINLLTTFIFTADPRLLSELIIKNLDNAMDMIFTLSDIACRYGIENPNMSYHLYRMENKNNQNNYGIGNMTFSFKSASKSRSEVNEFNTKDSIGISLDTDGFVPYIDVDNIVKSSNFSDEKEILFPPCIGSMISGKQEDIYGNKFTNVVLTDKYQDKYNNNSNEYESIKKDFINEIFKCKKDKVTSDKLKQYCSIVGNYMYSTLRNKYHSYAEYYNRVNGASYSR